MKQESEQLLKLSSHHGKKKKSFKLPYGCSVSFLEAKGVRRIWGIRKIVRRLTFDPDIYNKLKGSAY